MRKLVSWLKDSYYIKTLPPACRMCAKGSKMVVLITGLCPSNCFYCPLSAEKQGKDRIFADEWELKNENDTEKLITEAKLIEATGAGITGGDPLFVWKRTKKYIKLLKENFGKDFNIHLYTSGLKNSDKIEDLVSVDLDEIRFHPDPKYWVQMDANPISKYIIETIKLDVDVGLEIPVIPNMKNEIFSLIRWADVNQLKWINLNELEFSETNSNELIKRGFTVKNDISSAVKGSKETAIEIINDEKIQDLNIGLHYCSSSFKDGVQLKNRIKRRAKNITKDFEIITEEGTILKGIIESSDIKLNEIVHLLKEKFNIGTSKFFVNTNRVEIEIKTLKKISKQLNKLGIDSYIIEVYPTADGLEVERIPL
jgi:hypothetical protein